MTLQTTSESQWWETTPKEMVIPLAFVKVDRCGATCDWQGIPHDDVLQLRARYTGAVDEIARTMDAARPLNWQGDGTMIFLTDGCMSPGQDDLPAPVRAFHAARRLWERLRIDLGIRIRIGVHAAYVKWDPETGKLAHPAIDVCGHLEESAPENSIVVSEDVYLMLPEEERSDMACLGITSRDRMPAFVFPAAAAARKDADAFVESDDLVLWQAFRAYAQSPEVRLLRYVGFPTTKKEPPCLDVKDVFVVPEVTWVRRRRLKPSPEWPDAVAARSSGRRHVSRQSNVSSSDYQGPIAGSVDLPFMLREELAEGAISAPLDEFFRGNRSFVLLGEPGSGKTTSIRWLAVMAALGRWHLEAALGVAERLLPLPVSVGRLAETWSTLGDFPAVIDALALYFHNRNVADRNRLCEFLTARLEAGECLVLLDGLDEVKYEQRSALRAWLESFAAVFKKNRFIVSSRRVGYLPFNLPDGVEVVLQPFSDEQVARYVRVFTKAYLRWEAGGSLAKWMEGQLDKGAADVANELIEAIASSPRLGALARNPFLLSAIALIHRAEGRLPRHRIQVYDAFARVLCEAWAWARRLVTGHPKVDIPFEEEAVPILGDLALAMHEKYPAGIAPEDFVVGTLAKSLQNKKGVPPEEAEKSAREFLKKAGSDVQILVERGAREWGFLHLTFQEFFAAVGLHAEELFDDFVLEHLFDSRWEEVIRLGVGYMVLVQRRLKATENLIKRILKQADKKRPWLTEVLGKHVVAAALLAGEAGDALPADLQRDIAEQLAKWVLTAESSVAGRVCNEIAQTDFRVPASKELVAMLEDKNWLVRGMAALALGNLRAELAVEPLIKALRDKSVLVRRKAVEALGNLKAKAVIERLIDALRDEDATVRGYAAEVLGNLKAAAAVEPLMVAELRDKDGWVRWSAAEALGKLKAAAAVDPLINALQDKHELVRGQAAETLENLKAEVAVEPLIEALRDEDAWVRMRAAEALGNLKAAAAVEPLLKAWHDFESESMMREAIFKALWSLAESTRGEE